ncbi:DUF4998 domain-containing protein [Niabella yanshanensis]|uniref:DUF4998 domain-containing protein n=1 Tax=Niabella yanshanensis TaxID=577386 RepID=A0ABZ0W7J3_9BACT|nr:DUF4998 domain-containing protein [Niabella yanshanensis]WQD38036.1 DUF4998 domain-containing protein [Niabella yanshanensis]
MNSKNNIIIAISLLFLAISCKRYDNDYLRYFDGKESVYPGLVKSLTYRAGNLRTALSWNPSPDPSVIKYVVKWNNGQDSVVVPASSHNPEDLVSVTIPNLSEYVYSFIIYSYDDKGNRSIGQEINNVRVYGDAYKSLLQNRNINAADPYVYADNGILTLNFANADTSNASTFITYTNTSNTTERKTLLPGENTIVINNYKSGTPITYNSSYIPEKNAIDTFQANTTASFPTIYRYVICPKNKFSPLSLYGDGQPYDNSYWTSLWTVFDGATSPKGWYNGFHSNDAKTLPYPISFDMGATYNSLSHFEIIGRDCCHNPVEYEVWGSNTQNVPNLEGNNPNWGTQMQANGWTLLQSVNRTDDGKAPFKSSLIDNPPPVRYIRVLIKKVASGESKYSNFSQVTLWNRE